VVNVGSGVRKKKKGKEKIYIKGSPLTYHRPMLGIIAKGK